MLCAQFSSRSCLSEFSCTATFDPSNAHTPLTNQCTRNPSCSLNAAEDLASESVFDCFSAGHDSARCRQNQHDAGLVAVDSAQLQQVYVATTARFRHAFDSVQQRHVARAVFQEHFGLQVHGVGLIRVNVAFVQQRAQESEHKFCFRHNHETFVCLLRLLYRVDRRSNPKMKETRMTYFLCDHQFEHENRTQFHLFRLARQRFSRLMDVTTHRLHTALTKTKKVKITRLGRQRISQHVYARRHSKFSTGHVQRQIANAVLFWN